MCPAVSSLRERLWSHGFWLQDVPLPFLIFSVLWESYGLWSLVWFGLDFAHFGGTCYPFSHKTNSVLQFCVFYFKFVVI